MDSQTPGDPEGDPGETQEAPETPYMRARARAIGLAKAGASDDEIAAVLRSELSTTRPRAIMTATEVDRRLQQWARDGILEDARTAGRLAPLEALLDAATFGDGRDRVAAASYLAKRQDDPAGPALAALLRRLKDMTPEQLAAYVAEHAGG